MVISTVPITLEVSSGLNKGSNVTIKIYLSSGTSGTGSYPPSCHGWQRHIRFIPSQPPFKSPNFSIASFVYSEQVGL